LTSYSSIRDIWDEPIDGLIVTGAEPRAAKLIDEPYWGNLTELLDWAEGNTLSTICSCLAAHAAVFHLDGIERRPFREKRFGVFDGKRKNDHPLLAETAPHFRMPHSRWNDIPEEALISYGYTVLTKSNDAFIDAFVKQQNSLF